LSGPWVDEQVRCSDPECPGTAEPEYDDDLRYYACTACGAEFGFTRVRAASAEGGTCQLGIGADARARFSQPAGRPEPVLLTIGRRPE
jgi:hypothetical protein